MPDAEGNADAERLYEALGIPCEAEVDRRVPKSALVEQGGLSPTDRRAAEAGIERLTWRATLAPGEAGLPAYADAVRDYAQLVVMAVQLREGAKAERLVEVVHRAIAHPLVLIAQEGGGGATLSVGLKRRHEREAGRVVVERLAVSPPLDACAGVIAEPFLASLPLAAQPAADLWLLHEGWAARLEALAIAQTTGVFRAPKDAADAAARREAFAAYQAAAAKAVRLRRAAATERRLNVRIERAGSAARAGADAERLKARLL